MNELIKVENRNGYFEEEKIEWVNHNGERKLK